MEITTHQVNQTQIAEVISDGILIQTPEDGLQLLVDLYYQDFDKIIVREQNITPAFFELKTGIAGEILQKFSNYRVRLVIIGDFAKYPGKSIQDFIYESNNGRQINFLDSLEEALEKLSG
ncbi:hypothetical protein HDF26_002148 [Pedobacter cryoconitis]|uniref:DUF4180 domain-containing protein n=1 Tax=Pedobacter cryoconitis TaxID=188932 RepID=A0A7W9DZ30_9SPHI|nr:DUF4180 domain-containing protein [Pedobacter cryoconitis]MBB5635125.1 hypothetical protein [Pedobacter cryoconitis]MBB6271691.1 hypothetical protein [Pedobacter cryoconitis]